MNTAKGAPKTVTLELTRGERKIMENALRYYRKKIGDHHSGLMELRNVKAAPWKHYYAVDELLAKVVGVTDENNSRNARHNNVRVHQRRGGLFASVGRG